MSEKNIKSNLWKTAVYIRLSQEDKETRFDEGAVSNSVINQQQIIDEFIRNNSDLGEYTTFIDDGLSGTTFERKGFQDMFREIQLGNINCVVVKDLSRFGRNYAEAGMYIEQVFPTLGVRFIAINDYVDSYLRPNEMNSILIPLKNVLNDSYSRDLSVKVKSGMTAVRKRGEYIGPFAPYGYKFHEDDRHKLVIDEEVAPVVRDIFKWYSEDLGKIAIVQRLNRMGIPSPAKYRTSNYPPKKNHSKEYASRIAGLWCVSNITRILENSTYCGDISQGKRTNISYKNRKQINIPKEDWIIVKDTHEPIVSRELFERVNELSQIRTRARPKTGVTHLFAGVVYCGDCNKALSRCTNKRKTVSRYVYYCCSTYYRLSKDACTSHIMPEAHLKTLVFNAIKLQIDLFVDIDKVINESLAKKKRVNNKVFLEKQLDKLIKDVESIEKLKIGLYADLKKDLLDEKDYLLLKNNYTTEINSITEQIENVRTEIFNCEDDDILYKTSIERFKQFKYEDILTRELLTSLVKRIYIYENKSIEIVFKFALNINV